VSNDKEQQNEVVAAGETVDTPEFMVSICEFYNQSSCEEFDQPAYDAARATVVAHIDAYARAHAAREVAAADKGARYSLARAIGLGLSQKHSFAWSYMLGLVEEAFAEDAMRPTTPGDFAKIVRASNGQQVLFYTEVSCDEGNVLHCVANFDDLQADLKFGGLPDDAFAEALAKADTKMADSVLAQVGAFSGEQEGDQ